MLSYNELKKKYPDKIPIIVKKANGCKLNDLKKNKFLVFNTMTLGEFHVLVKKYLNISSTESLILFTNKCLLPNSKKLINIQNEHYPNDFLIIEYSGENTFG
jgi:hypothetical protein